MAIGPQSPIIAEEGPQSGIWRQPPENQPKFLKSWQITFVATSPRISAISGESKVHICFLRWTPPTVNHLVLLKCLICDLARTSVYLSLFRGGYTIDTPWKIFEPGLNLTLMTHLFCCLCCWQCNCEWKSNDRPNTESSKNNSQPGSPSCSSCSLLQLLHHNTSPLSPRAPLAAHLHPETWKVQLKEIKTGDLATTLKCSPPLIR